MKAFRAYFEPIFLYNCKIWTIPPSQAVKTINPFQWRLLRTYVLNIKWPNIVKNEDTHRNTAATEWSKIIREQRLKWYGCSNHSNLEMEAECLTKDLSGMIIIIIEFIEKNGKNKL